MCELKSLQDNNRIPLIFVENGFNQLTSQLLSNNIVVCCQCTRHLSANLEIYLECHISEQTVKVLGMTVPGFQYEDILPSKIEDQITRIVAISGEVIQRNRVFVYARVIDLNFIKFEFVCELCDGGTLLSLCKCINQCMRPKPVLKIHIICTVTDQ